VDVPAGTVLFRTCDVRYPDPAYFGRALTYRFDAPDQSYGVCYLGTTLACCLLETVPLRKRRRSRTLIIDAGVLNQRYAAYATVRRDLRLAWLADAGLVRNGADTRITGGDNYTASRRWSKACHDHTSQLDGILYPSRRENTLYSVALFERATDALDFTAWGPLSPGAVPDLWREIVRFLEMYQIEVLS
jgi:hypothetical protein